MKNFSKKLVVKKPSWGKKTKKWAKRAERNYTRAICRDLEKFSAVDNVDCQQNFRTAKSLEKYITINNWLFRFLHKNVGQPWYIVHSELSQKFDKRSYAGFRLWEGVDWFLSKNPEDPVQGMFILDEHGLLQLNDLPVDEKVQTLEEKLAEEKEGYDFVGTLLFRERDSNGVLKEYTPWMWSFKILKRGSKLFWGESTSTDCYRQDKELNDKEYKKYNAFSERVKDLITLKLD